MAEDTRLGAKIKGQIRRFAGALARGWTKPKRRLAWEMLYGIQAGQDVKLSNIGRSLNERIALIKTENRLRRQLAGEDLSERINRWLCWAGAGAVDEETVLAVDLGDITKPDGRKMDYWATVRDGREGELAKGYWRCEVVAAHP